MTAPTTLLFIGVLMSMGGEKKMVSDTAIIAVGLISMLGMILSIQLLNMNWFKRENFKLKRDLTRKEIDLKMKKMSRELGLDTKKGVSRTLPEKTGGYEGTGDLIKALAPAVLSKLAPEDIRDLAQQFLPEGAETGMGQAILQYVNDNPAIIEDVIAPLLKGFTQGKQEGETGQEPTPSNPQGGFI